MSILKKSVTSCFIFLISFATCNETMAYLFQSLGDSSYSWVNNLSSEEKGEEETQESVKKTEAFNSEDELFLHKLVSPFTQLNTDRSLKDHIFPSSDYSEEVFFPPEIL